MGNDDVGDKNFSLPENFFKVTTTALLRPASAASATNSLPNGRARYCLLLHTRRHRLAAVCSSSTLALESPPSSSSESGLTTTSNITSADPPQEFSLDYPADKVRIVCGEGRE